MGVPEEFIHLRFPENFGRAWVELLESNLSEHARICYVAMTSFGRESRAGKASIRRRMGIKSITTVKEAQKELQASGWIRKLREGGLDGKTPTEWEVYSKPFNGQLPLLGLQTPGTLGAPPEDTERPTPGRVAAPKQEDKHESKQENKSKKHPDQDDFWKFCSMTFKVVTGHDLIWPKAKGFQTQMTDGLTTLGIQELSRRWDNYLAYQWGAKSPLGFFHDLNKWSVKPETKKGASGGRAFNQPETDWTPDTPRHG